MEMKRNVVIVAVLLCTVVVWTLGEEDGVYECKQALNRATPTDRCSVTISNCGPCVDGYEMDTPNVACFRMGFPRWQNWVNYSVSNTGSFEAAGRCEWLKSSLWPAEDERCVHGHPPPPGASTSRCLGCNLTIVSQTALGRYVLKLNHVTAFVNSTAHYDMLTISMNDCTVEVDADWSVTDDSTGELAGGSTGDSTGDSMSRLPGGWLWITMACCFVGVVAYAVLLCLCCRQKLCFDRSREGAGTRQPTSSSAVSKATNADVLPFSIFPLNSTAAAA